MMIDSSVPLSSDEQQRGDYLSVIGHRKGKSGEDLSFEFFRGKLLGKGAFATCYEMCKKTEMGRFFAGKLIEKGSLSKNNVMNKLYNEIKNHSSLKHENIVRFYNYFEDDNYFYLILEMCPQKTLRSLLRRRRKLTEFETRYYVKQVIAAVQYMHSKSIIHRDLKLDNIFLKDMTTKIGDFGLSVKMVDENEKKKTVCGTPNYMAPEVISKAGHSFPVDIWAIGIIMYSLLIGKPPFETNNVNDTYKKISNNDYCFPTDSDISAEAKDLIKQLLDPNPDTRPKLPNILAHPFFSGYIPSVLPEYTLQKSPLLEYQNRGTLSPEKPILKSNVLRKPLVSVGNALGNTADPHDPHKINKKRPLPPDAEVPTPNKKFIPSTDVLDSPGLKKILATLTDFLKRNSENEGKIEKPLQNTEDIPGVLWVSKWVDYSQKYGLGYVLRDSSIGATFIDRTRVIQYPTENSVSYIESDDIVQTVPVDQNSMDPKKKKRLILHSYFKDYLHRCVASAGLEVEQDWKLKSGSPVFIRKWIKSQEYIAFFLSDDTTQINFFDHRKIIVSKDPKDEVILTFVENNSTRFIKKLSSIDSPPCDLLSRIKSLKDCISQNINT